MENDVPLHGHSWAPPFVQPFLDALTRMQQRTALQHQVLIDRAAEVLRSRLGPAEAPISTGFGTGMLGVVADHTHYFDGFALLMPMAQGTAVAVRRSASPGSRLVFDGDPAEWSFDRQAIGVASQYEDWPWWCTLALRLTDILLPPSMQVDIAVVNTVVPYCEDAFVSALGVALVEALKGMPGTARPADDIGVITEAASTCLMRPIGIAYTLAAGVRASHNFILVDTAIPEYIGIDVPKEQVGFGLIHADGVAHLKPGHYDRRREQVDKIVRTVRAKAFPALRSLRDLQHRHLEKGLEVLPRKLRPLLRHLVVENQRVQKLVAAIKRTDWQLFGALLIMSHASCRADWGTTTDRADAAVAFVEGMSLEGMYGASGSSPGGAVFVAGQPYTVPQTLDRVALELERQFEARPDVLLL